MLSNAWAGTASAAGDGIVASAFGSAPLWAAFALVLTAAAGGALAARSGLTERRRRRRRFTPPAPPEHSETIDEDGPIVDEVGRLVGPRDLRWLRGHDFAMPWRGTYVQPWADLLHFGANGSRPRDAGLRGAFDALMRAATSFMDTYDRSTFRDELLLTDDWRDIGWSAGDAETLEGTEREILEERRALLSMRAVELGNAFETFLEVAGRAGPSVEIADDARQRVERHLP